VCKNFIWCVLCVVFFYFVNIFPKKKILLHYAFEHVHDTAFDLAFVCSTAAPHHTHTLMHACVRTYPVSLNAELSCPTCTKHECGRTHLRTFERTRAEPLQDLFLGHFSPISPIFTVASYAPLPLLPRSPPPITP
jgi:hypothetical protein